LIGALLTSPSAGLGAAAQVADSVAARLRASLSRLDTLVASTPQGSAELAARAVEAGVDLLVVLGGDGLAHVALQVCADSETLLAVIPAGTGNDLARALGCPLEPFAATEAILAELAAGRSHRIDLGRIAGGGSCSGAWFGTVLCAGFDSRVNELANRLRWPRGPRRYDLAILSELVRLRPGPLEVRTPAETLRLDATMVAVGNAAWYGGGIPICPDAVLDDGLFDLTVVAAMSRTELARVLPRLRTGRHVDHPAVTALRAASVTLSGGSVGVREWIGYADGERQAGLPLTLSCEAGVLRVVAPGLSG
jgi:diacylglycerol kinase (ATP)